MTLTKKHFKAIAEIIKANGYFNCTNGIKYLVANEFIQELSNYFKSINPNFNEDKFKEACSK